jgi:SpoVK/Ycf46/Vps4 family AAA+-type ATPase
MATNRPDILDAALMRPGRLDRKIEIPLPNDAGRLEILKIHAGPISRKGEIDWDAVVKLSEGFNGADMRNVCTEAGMFAIREDRDYVVEDDFMKVRGRAGARPRRPPTRRRLTHLPPSLFPGRAQDGRNEEARVQDRVHQGVMSGGEQREGTLSRRIGAQPVTKTVL